ncbi:uncharacterized protein P174DRAFT_434798 [Aspergillus novofumigatus IBT 16806]|uniref:Peptidase M12A domain-containing protein n=1 Tax=Aspergillus novofumigatus (strain IBT 16806) TaxID=1392255 RepID=A0A2I1BYJ8_ASPN1|nr:uncharacterized protein P174DRAFT_434798 [Aspergillus novofumigatus IBT 16806]PKX90421.1 hypothetical protein P174DRAFT_434798 [Aspergillus novofumigatus IBT 16806]
MGAGPAAGFWPPNKHVLIVCFLNGGEFEQSTVKSLVRTHYNSIPMRLRFKFLSERDTSPSDIRILFTDHSKAYIGRQAEAYPGQPTMWLNMHPRLPTQDAARDKVQADVLHEFGHALGLVHEHKHPQCKAKWNYGQLMDRNRWDLDVVRRNYDDDTHSAINARWDRAYDPESIMHYAIARGDTQSGLREVPENIVLSNGDKETLARIYPSVAVVKQHSTMPKEPTKGHEKEKREKKIGPEKWKKPSQKSSIYGNDSAVVCGGYVKVSGNASVMIHGGGHVILSGNSNTVVYGDSTVWASGNAHVYVNGGGSARVSGNAAVEFTGTATGEVTGNGSIRWNV